MGLMKKLRNSYFFTHLEVGKYTKRRTSQSRDFTPQDPKFYEENYVNGQYVNSESPSLEQSATNAGVSRDPAQYHRYSKSLSTGLDSLGRNAALFDFSEAASKPMPTTLDADDVPVRVRKTRKGIRRDLSNTSETEDEKKRRQTIYEEEFSHAFGYDRQSIYVGPLGDFVPVAENYLRSQPESSGAERTTGLARSKTAAAATTASTVAANPHLAHLRDSPASRSESGLDNTGTGGARPRPRPRPSGGSDNRQSVYRKTVYDPRSMSSLDYYYFSPSAKGSTADKRISKMGVIAPSTSNPFDLHKAEEQAQLRLPAPISPSIPSANAFRSRTKSPGTPQSADSTTATGSTTFAGHHPQQQQQQPLNNDSKTNNGTIGSRPKRPVSRYGNGRTNTLYIPPASSMNPDHFEAPFSPANPSVRAPNDIPPMARSKTASSSRALDGDSGPARNLKHHASATFAASPPLSLSNSSDVSTLTGNGERKHLITPILPNIEQHLQARPPAHVYC
ncbi:hypothetical protein EV182_000953 [Spiromyces aspiralis]|uniref:Uncharacterized protein n=1 Tax=Spiromyces aspiralis TaxID=68401 RepID=A0ACC1HVB0_9FUNG|nr:hypothetical protein EV182_000953 [Spiromyces aspiralis]